MRLPSTLHIRMHACTSYIYIYIHISNIFSPIYQSECRARPGKPCCSDAPVLRSDAWVGSDGIPLPSPVGSQRAQASVASAARPVQPARAAKSTGLVFGVAKQTETKAMGGSPRAG